MTKKTVEKFALNILLAAALLQPVVLYAQSSGSGVSRPMEQAIRLYHEGEDTEAMDRFMVILTKGTPAERALANEYISKITMRMNTGVNTAGEGGAEASTLNEVSDNKPEPEVERQPAEAAPEEDEAGEDNSKANAAAAQKERINEKISSKITQMRREILTELGRSSSVKIYMGESLPRALTLDTNAFFSGETSFRASNSRDLALLAGLIFTLGKADCLIVPEGSAEGDVKIKSIRRALALNSYFDSRGISKSRLGVALTGAEIRFPKELTSTGGMVIIFDYDKEPRLKDLEDRYTKGPKVSLGVYPTAISVSNNEGAVVEFSVFESPDGKPTWKFQVFEVQKDGGLLKLQEIASDGPQYNQSFWNGRRKFFGAPYPSGRYLFKITAADVSGRETSLSRQLVVRPAPGEQKSPAAAVQAKPGARAKSKTRVFVPAGARGSKPGKAVKAAAGKKSKQSALKKSAAKASARKHAAARKAGGESAGSQDKKEAGSDPAPAEPLSYKIYFKENTASITANSEKKLAQVAEMLGYYPMANITLTGYAYSGEANADAMAENRADYVAARLADKYKIDRARMEMKSKVSETPKSIVEITMAGKE